MKQKRKYKILHRDEVNLLLSYIEQLEKDNKDLDKENQLLFESNLNLQNNRDKAYKFVKEKRKVFEWYDTDLFYLESLLKGDSE